MPKKAPHLPSSTPSTHGMHRFVDRVLWLIVFLLFSILGGGATALATVSWLVPAYWSDGSVYIRDRAVSATPNELIDPLFSKQLDQRSLTILHREDQPAAGWYTPSAVIGRAALLSADGWAVIYLPEYVSGDELLWDVRQANGTKLTVSRAVYDDKTNLVYIKVQGSGFQVFSFAPFDSVSPEQGLWAVNDTTWMRTHISGVKEADRELPLLSNHHVYTLSAVPQGALLISDQGQLSGIAVDNTMLPSYWISEQLPHILSMEKIVYPSVSAQGTVVANRDVSGQIEYGFFVSKITPSSKTQLLPGDIIVAINGKALRPMDFVGDILKQETLTVTRLRKNMTETIILK